MAAAAAAAAVRIQVCVEFGNPESKLPTRVAVTRVGDGSSSHDATTYLADGSQLASRLVTNLFERIFVVDHDVHCHVTGTWWRKYHCNDEVWLALLTSVLATASDNVVMRDAESTFVHLAKEAHACTGSGDLSLQRTCEYIARSMILCAAVAFETEEDAGGGDSGTQRRLRQRWCELLLVHAARQHDAKCCWRLLLRNVPFLDGAIEYALSKALDWYLDDMMSEMEAEDGGNVANDDDAHRMVLVWRVMDAMRASVKDDGQNGALRAAATLDPEWQGVIAVLRALCRTPVQRKQLQDYYLS